MKYFFVLLFGLFTTEAIKAQTSSVEIETHEFSQIISLPKYYKEQGIIFNKDYKISIHLSNLQTRYTPNILDISKAEEILMTERNLKLGIKKMSVKYLSNCIRQYIGFIDNSGNKNIIVQLIDNSNPRKVKRIMGNNLQDNFVLQLSNDFYKLSSIYKINIDKNLITTEL